MGSPRGWGQADGAPWQAGGGGSQGRCQENEGGWSIPEAAGARGCLLGCAGPTRGSFGAATPAGDRTGKGPEGRGRGASGGGAHTLPGPCPPGTSLEETCPGRWETGPGWREKCPEKRMVPVGSGDVCSTVHGSYRLSTEPLPSPMTASRPAQPQPHTCMWTGWQHRTISCPLGTRS